MSGQITSTRLSLLFKYIYPADKIPKSWKHYLMVHTSKPGNKLNLSIYPLISLLHPMQWQIKKGVVFGDNSTSCQLPIPDSITILYAYTYITVLKIYRIYRIWFWILEVFNWIYAATEELCASCNRNITESHTERRLGEDPEIGLTSSRLPSEILERLQYEDDLLAVHQPATANKSVYTLYYYIWQ